MFLVGDQCKALQIFAFIEATTKDLHLPDAPCDNMMRHILQYNPWSASHSPFLKPIAIFAGWAGMSEK